MVQRSFAQKRSLRRQDHFTPWQFKGEFFESHIPRLEEIKGCVYYANNTYAENVKEAQSLKLHNNDMEHKIAAQNQFLKNSNYNLFDFLLLYF